ncbi:MAG: hypothetical protein MUO21_10650, partial [Nitrososphaeraceae archaeon]|nr:hypothetical protein [Nitrososphaeraceae archaeon]
HRILSREPGEKGNVKYLHKFSHTTVQDGVATVLEEYIIFGEKGLMFKHYSKNEKSKTKIVGRQNADGTFHIKMVDGDKVDEKTMSKDEVLKMLAKDKNLKFALDYLKSHKEQKGGKRSKKASKKSSKRKTSKRKLSKKSMK